MPVLLQDPDRYAPTTQAADNPQSSVIRACNQRAITKVNAVDVSDRTRRRAQDRHRHSTKDLRKSAMPKILLVRAREATSMPAINHMSGLKLQAVRPPKHVGPKPQDPNPPSR